MNPARGRNLRTARTDHSTGNKFDMERVKMEKRLSMRLGAAVLIAVNVLLPAQKAYAANVPTADSVYALQQYLLNGETPDEHADADGNGILNAVDLTLMKRDVLKGGVPGAVPADFAALKLNEICAANKESCIAADGSSPDWIELYNSGDKALQLDGVGLSDSKKNRYSFEFGGGMVLQPHEYLLVFCDEKDTANDELHAPFKLSASGETVYLTAPRTSDGTDGETLEKVEFPLLDTDMTYAKNPDGTGEWKLLAATAGRSNADAAQLRVSAPEFSADGGFYDDAFQLTLSAQEGETILYTTDCSDPRTSPTAQPYTDGIWIHDTSDEPCTLLQECHLQHDWYHFPSAEADKGMVVRAVCKNEKSSSYSRVVTNTYFVQQDEPFYQTLKVISISTDQENLASDSKGIYNINNYYLTGKEWERPVNIQVFEKGKPRYSEDVGMRLAGSYSRTNTQKSMTFFARSEYGASKMKYDFFDGEAVDCDGNKIKEFEKITLRNGGCAFEELRFRDDMNAYFAKGLDISVQAKADCVVFLNGEFWGEYSLQEKLDENYCASHYHVKKNNVTTAKNNEADGEADLFNVEFYDFYKWALREDMSDDENYQRVCDVLDVQSFAEYVAVESYISNWDSLQTNNNIMLWRANEIDPDNPYADGRWRFMLFDTEWSANFQGETPAEDNYLEWLDDPNMWLDPWAQENLPDIHYGRLFLRLIDNADFAARFRAATVKLATEHFEPQRVSDRIDYYMERLTGAYLATADRYGIDFNLSLREGWIRTFFEERPHYAIAQCDHLLKLHGHANLVPDETEA